MNDFVWEDSTPLCCCEYVDHKGKRNHILACCCNCVELDLCCDRCLSCNRVSTQQTKEVMITCFDRLRFPYRGGARKLTLTILPVLLLPLLVLIGIQTFETLTLTLFLLPCILIYSTFYFTKHSTSTLFFYYWTVTSAIYVAIIFELSVVPQLEIYPHENFELICLSAVSFIFFYFTKCSSLNVHDNEVNGELLSNGSLNNSTQCPVCACPVYPRQFHCRICHQCIPKFHHHCIWLNCCIGEHNQHFFVMGLLFAVIACVYGSMLTLTSICRPIFVWGLLVPEDCSDVLSDSVLGADFMAAVYIMQVAICMLFILLHHVYLISSGFTGLEWRQQPKLTFCTSSPYSRGFLQNWVYFFKSFKKFHV